MGKGPDTWKRDADAIRQNELIRRSDQAKLNIERWRHRACKSIERGEYEIAMNIITQIGLELKHV